jgi:hypothetical protein
MAEIILTKDIQPDDIISFTTYGSSIIPNVVNGKVLAIESGTGLINPTTAAANAANIFPSLPANNNLSRDYTTYKYFRIRLADNTTIEIAEPWINPTSVSRLVRKRATLVINDFDSSQSDTLLNLLAQHGFVNVVLNVN